MVCSSARRKELKITRKMRAAWAGLSVLRQELFRATCEDPDTFGMSISCYQACMRFSFGYLVHWGSAAVAARCILGGPKCKVIYYYGGDQIWSEANYFYAEISC